MLVLSRKPSETLYIGDNIKITVVRIGWDAVRLGIEAPREMNIRRSELAAANPQSRRSNINDAAQSV